MITKVVKFIKINPDAVAPSHKTRESAGVDFHSVEDVILEKGQTRAVKTGIRLELPEGTHLQVRSRSGLALFNQVIVLNAPGTIDSDYRGEIKAVLMNLGREPFKIKKGDRIAQGVLTKHYVQKWKKVSELSETERGTKGFGSTGVN